MKVFTKWPALVPAIRRAGHEPVLLDSESEPPAEATPVVVSRLTLDEVIEREYLRDRTPEPARMVKLKRKPD